MFLSLERAGEIEEIYGELSLIPNEWKEHPDTLDIYWGRLKNLRYIGKISVEDGLEMKEGAEELVGRELIYSGLIRDLESVIEG